MPLVLVSDTSVLIDLHRGSLLENALRLPFDLAVPDLLFERELRGWDGLPLEGRIAVLSLGEDGVVLADTYRRREARLSLPDAFALALAKVNTHTLLSGDASLRSLAEAEGVECHGVLWLVDQLEQYRVATLRELLEGLTRISEHPRCRLPKAEVRKRLGRYGDAIAE